MCLWKVRACYIHWIRVNLELCEQCLKLECSLGKVSDKGLLARERSHKPGRGSPVTAVRHGLKLDCCGWGSELTRKEALREIASSQDP